MISWLKIVACVISTLSQSPRRMHPIRVYSWYGYFATPFPRGVGYSRGLDVPGDKLRALPGVTIAPTHANPIGHGRLHAAPDFPGAIRTIELNVLHQRIASGRNAHDICIDAVQALVARPRERIPA